MLVFFDAPLTDGDLAFVFFVSSLGLRALTLLPFADERPEGL
jgi:hypothetical protein